MKSGASPLQTRLHSESSILNCLFAPARTVVVSDVSGRQGACPRYHLHMSSYVSLPSARAIARACLVCTAILLAPAAAHADTLSKKVRFDGSDTVPVGLTVEGIEVGTIRFSLEGGVKLNPFKTGRGPQAFMAVKNTGTKGLDFALAVVLYDEKGAVIAASESNHLGDLDPGETGEIEVMFRYVKRKVYSAKTVEIVLETLPQ